MAAIPNYSLVFLQVTWLRTCLGTLLAMIRFLSQMSSLVSLLWCPPNPEHAVRHCLDWYGSSMCFLVCLILSRKCLLRHSLQSYGLSPEWVHCWCIIRLRASDNVLGHCIQWYGFSPESWVSSLVATCYIKCLRTLFTRMWLLPWMSSSVFLQTNSLRNCLRTFFTRIWPLSSMSSLVYFELPCFSKCLATFLKVDSHKHFQSQLIDIVDGMIITSDYPDVW